MSRFQFTENAWSDYLYWQSLDKKTLRKINDLLKDMERNGVDKGQGKPELLKGELSGFYSRRIDDKNRIVYREYSPGIIEIISLKGHYQDK